MPSAFGTRRIVGERLNESPSSDDMTAMRFASKLCPLCFGLAMLPGRSAEAAEALLVVVEVSGAAVTAQDVRAAVAKETRGIVTGPFADPVETDSDALLVAVDAQRASLCFRPQRGEARQRTVDLPDSHKDQLRTIGWMAMNLVTNQVLGRVDQDPPATSAETPSAATSLNDQATPRSNDQQPAALEPPPAPQALAPVTAPPQPPAAAAKANEPVGTGWSVAAFLGPRMSLLGAGYPESRLPWKWSWEPYYGGQEAEVEVQKRYADWQLGVALDLGAQDRPAIALAGFIGDGWQWTNLHLDGTAGVGVEMTARRVNTWVSENGSTGSSSTAKTTTELRPRLYGRGNITLAWQVRPAVALLLRLGLHIAPDSVNYCYGAALLGLRLNIP